MKKYLTLAAFLGAIAFLSVSYLAQAEPEAAPAAAAAASAPAAAPAVVDFAKDKAECDTLAAAATTEGATPTEAQKAESVHKCLVGKGHTEDAIKAEAEKAKAAAPAAEAPAAPAGK